jgi:hypothetical protein
MPPQSHIVANENEGYRVGVVVQMVSAVVSVARLRKLAPSGLQTVRRQ